jgi:hypothetical protein
LSGRALVFFVKTFKIGASTGFSHVLKMDDDVFVNLSEVAQGLLATGRHVSGTNGPDEAYNMRGVYMGCAGSDFIEPSKMPRDPNGKL